MGIKMIDVSSHNGTINWQQVKDSGVQFVMIRSSYGWFYRDNYLDTNVRGCETVGLPYGLYHYSYATNLDQAKIEVDNFLALANNYRPTLPLCLDMEDADGWKARNGNPSNAMLTEICDYFGKRIEQESKNKYFLLYANLDYFKNKLDGARLNRYDKWLAQWYVSAPAIKCGAWQYGANGRVPGINGNVDMNEAYINYPEVIKNLTGGGNQDTPAPQPVQPEKPAPSVVQHYADYVIPYGTTLNKIAQQFGTTADELQRLNSGLIKDKNKILAGWVIRVPVNESTSNNNSIQKGDRVRVLNAVQYNGKPFKKYFDVYDVLEVNGDRAVIGIGNQVTCAINVANLQKV